MKRTVLLVVLLNSLFAAGAVMAEGMSLMSSAASRADWEARLPVLALIVLFVLVVDAAFVIPALRKLQTMRRVRARR
jgi:hypothetical protein